MRSRHLRRAALAVVMGLVSFNASAAQTHSKLLRFGLSGGLGWNSGTIISASGFGFSFENKDDFEWTTGLSLSFFQDFLLGLHLNFDMYPASITTQTFSALVGTASGTVGFNFNAFSNRHFIGLGVCASRYWDQKAAGAPGTAFGFTFEGKDYWPKDGAEFFLSVRWHVPSLSGALNNSLLLQLGLDF